MTAAACAALWCLIYVQPVTHVLELDSPVLAFITAAECVAEIHRQLTPLPPPKAQVFDPYDPHGDLARELRSPIVLPGEGHCIHGSYDQVPGVNVP
jgi:hypothetical protein